jgi:eukaryotic-like serine/threonine-protein kinase
VDVTLPPGTLLAGRYRIVRPIGQGGMGVVYEAEHIALGRHVALKVLFDHDKKAMKRFQQEGRAMAKLAHPHIVAIVDYIAQVGDPPILAMELLQGESLKTVLEREGALSIERCVRLATQILRGLAAAHDAGIVHRDVKPSNVFLVRDERGEESVKLLDFGVAKLFDFDAVATTFGGVIGTTSYYSPEQLRYEKGLKIDGRADLHAVGIILYEMLAGRRPWKARAASIS